MKRYYLIMKWVYDYDKEGTWFDTDAGEEAYELTEGAAYTLPHISKKSLELRSVSKEGDAVCAEIYVDHNTVTVLSDGNPVAAHVSDSYSVAGDSVHQSLSLTLTIELREG